MKLGFVSSILEQWNLEEMLGTAADLGFTCVEAACWPKSKAERRYAGVSHIAVDGLDEKGAKKILDLCASKKVTLSSLAFYPNTLDPDPDKRAANIGHLYKVIDASAMLGVGLVTTFIGRDQYKSVEDNLEIVKEVWPPILEYAKKQGVRIGIENCPMLFGREQWPGGQNLMSTPENWDRIFEALPYDNLGLNYDPSHFIWQMMDYIRPIYEYKDKLFHIHFKDIKLYPDKLARAGIMAYPLDYMAPKLPGLGDIDWGRFLSALTDIGYDSCACIEVEDRAFEESKEKILDSLRLSKKYLEQFMIFH